LILPDDQILYTSLTAPTDDPEMTAFRIEEGLEGMTPYAVSELVYDWRAFEADRVKLAVVARETLDEARGFAETHGFTPAGFAAMPPQERFPGVPLFDLADSAKDLSFSDEGIAFGPDTFGQEPEQPEPESDAASSEETVSADPVPADTAETGDNTPDAPVEAEAPDPDGEDPGPDRDAAAEPPTGPDSEPEPAPEPAPKEPDPEDLALDEAADRDPEEVIASAADLPPAPLEPGAPFDPADAAEAPPAEDLPDAADGIDAGAPPLEDRALTEPVAPIDDSGPEQDDDAGSGLMRAARKASAALDAAPPEFSSRGAPVPARDADAAPEAETAHDSRPTDDAAQDDATPAGQNPLAERLSRVRDASKTRPPRGGKPIVPPGRKGGPEAAPQRKGRLSGLTAAPFPGRGDAAGGAKPEPQTGLGGRLGGFLGRGGSDAAAPPAPTGDADGGGARSVSGQGRLTALGAALRQPTGDAIEGAGPTQDTTHDTAPGATEDSNLTGGLLGRKPDEGGRALLPHRPRADHRFPDPSGRDRGLVGAVPARQPGGAALRRRLRCRVDDPLDAPDAPLAITAPPAIGELAAVDAPPASLPENRPSRAPRRPETPTPSRHRPRG
jgi:hypothetical protein